MHYDYGYLRQTEGTDGDHVDVYVGPNTKSEKVFVIDQNKKPPYQVRGGWPDFDEQKVMLGFDSAKEAKAAYLKQYNDPRFFRSLKEMPMEEFRQKVLDRENHGKKIAARRRVLLELNLAKLSKGEPVLGENTPAVTKLPELTPYSRATHTNKDEKAADQQMGKAASTAQRRHPEIEKVAAVFCDDYEYLTEREKNAVVGALARMFGSGARASLRQGAGNLSRALKSGGGELGQKVKQRVQALPPKWNPTTAKNKALLTAGATGGAGLYATYKGIGAATDLARREPTPMAPQQYRGLRRTF